MCTTVPCGARAPMQGCSWDASLLAVYTTLMRSLGIEAGTVSLWMGRGLESLE